MTGTFSRVVLVLGVFAAVMASGCGSATTPQSFSAGVSPGLVMATAPESTTWEYRRNDGPLNAGRPPIAGAGWVEVRTYDRRRTSNGDPQEYSSTNTRTVTRNLSY